jgi:tripartite-type tricarboxylate transporter receptor subunit TctC
LAQVQAGNVKALAIAARKRSPMLPDVPTSYEQGLPEFRYCPVLSGIRTKRHAAGSGPEACRRSE